MGRKKGKQMSEMKIALCELKSPAKCGYQKAIKIDSYTHTLCSTGWSDAKKCPYQKRYNLQEIIK
jgi:hypothetical protein